MFQKKSDIEDFYGEEGGGKEYHGFLSKICLLAVPKKFDGEHFCV